jgi:alkylation response protein AidB-like acyl-CoA dehydrogenase
MSRTSSAVLRAPLKRQSHEDGCAAKFRRVIEDFLAKQWDVDLTVRAWWERLAASGFAFPTWPTGLGGLGLDANAALDIWRALARANVIGPPPGLGTLMGGPIVAAYGSPEQQARLLPALADGTEGWCQLFSEPGAGSDLASVSTRAERDGDEWVVTGQKVWTSGAHHSRRGMLIARTDWDQPKHHGLTYFIVDLDQTGVEIRPIRQMNGKSHFSEVFLNEVRINDDDRIGSVNRGWEVAGATLRFERSGLSAASIGGIKVDAGEPAGQLDRRVGDVIDEQQRRGSDEDEAAPGLSSSLRRLANEHGRHDDATRHALVDISARERIATMSQARARVDYQQGRAIGAESSLAKLWWTQSLRRSADTGLEILGAHGMLEGTLQTFALSVPSASIAGGTDDVQRNIVAERGLGLPKDLAVDTDVAFREVRRS